MNQRTGRMERVAVNLEAVYPDPTNPAVELCFEELRAAKRGWLQRDWSACRKNTGLGAASSKTATEVFPEVMENIDGADVERVQPPFDVPRMQDTDDISTSTHEEAPIPATQKQHREKLSIPHDSNDSAAPKIATERVPRPKSEKFKVLRENDVDIAIRPRTHTEDSQRQEKLQVLSSNKLSVPSEMPTLKQDASAKKQEKFAVFSGNDENAPLESIAPPKDDLARKLRKEERANRTRKIKLREETQTGQ